MDKIILICATGRSGSTTLQRLINTLPNCNICGENNGAINSLLEFYLRLKYTTQIQVPGHFNPAKYEDIVSKNVKPSWYNSYNLNKMIDMIKSLIVNMFKKTNETNIWGFKEIRYDCGNIKYLHAFRELFPQTKVIIQVRENVLAQSQSNFMRKNKNALRDLYALNTEFYNFYIKNKEFCYFITFEQMLKKENIYKLFTFIECSNDYDENKVMDVLNNNLKD
jgi:hypothetical protein